jgi:exopolysaccharide/PEP-CTERM locus tyrosine autokinase
MSLVEQAIAKMRQSAAGDGPVPKAAVLRDRLEDTARHNRLVEIDLAAMRQNGYMPETGIERQFAEHYRQIKRPLVERAIKGKAPEGGQDPRVVMITSALPGEGKSFTSSNLSFSLARERDISVLLVDADILKPRTSEVFGVKQEPGLMDALADEKVSIESLVLGTNIRGLSILPAGQFVEGAAELLLSNRMRQILADLLAYDPRRLIVLDSPPLLPTSEGRALTKVSGQVVLVARAGQTPVQALKDAIALLDPARFGGIVLNDAHLSMTETFYGYGAYGSPKGEPNGQG